MATKHFKVNEMSLSEFIKRHGLQDVYKLPMSINSDGHLLCPCCDYAWTHHGTVEIFDRAEDEEMCLHTVANHRKVQTNYDSSADGNPSLRRDGLIVHFTCEGCSIETQLTIAQHKGQTEMYFVVRFEDMLLSHRHDLEETAFKNRKFCSS